MSDTVSAAATCIELSSIDDLTKLLSEKRNIVLDFHATWCLPCKMVGKILGDMSLELASYSACVVRINVDNFQELASKYVVRSIPTLIFLKLGSVESTGILVGAVTKSQIQQALAKYFE